MKKNSISMRQKEKRRPREIKGLLLSAIPQPWGGEVVQIAELGRRAGSDCAAAVRESSVLIRFVLKGGFDGLRFLYRRTGVQSLNRLAQNEKQASAVSEGIYNGWGECADVSRGNIFSSLQKASDDQQGTQISGTKKGMES